MNRRDFLAAAAGVAMFGPSALATCHREASPALRLFHFNGDWAVATSLESAKEWFAEYLLGGDIDREIEPEELFFDQMHSLFMVDEDTEERRSFADRFLEEVASGQRHARLFATENY